MDETLAHHHKLLRSQGVFYRVVIIKDLDIANIKFLESILNKKPLGIRMVLFFLAPYGGILLWWFTTEI
jgi:hypothetical protein